MLTVLNFSRFFSFNLITLHILYFYILFKPLLPVGAGGGYIFSGRPSVLLSVRPSVRDSRGSFMFPRYLQYPLMDFRQTFVTGASRDRDELITFWGQVVKVQGRRHFGNLRMAISLQLVIRSTPCLVLG